MKISELGLTKDGKPVTTHEELIEYFRRVVADWTPEQRDALKEILLLDAPVSSKPQ